MENKQNEQNQIPIPPAFELFKLATGYMSSQAIYVAAKLGIADLLKNGSKNVDEIAHSINVNKNSLYRLLRVLASIGIFVEVEERVFDLTEKGSMLRSDIPLSLRPQIMLMGDKAWWYPWGNLLESVVSGEEVFDKIFNKTYMEYLENNPETLKIFNDCMTSVSDINNPAIVSSYDFSECKKILDIGGGHGSFISAILKEYPSITGILFDLPSVLNSIKNFDREIEGRIEIKTGDFFKEVPPGGEIYLLKQIIHDWKDDLSIKILSNCREVMTKNSRVLVVELMIEPGNKPDIAKFFDLHMMLTSTGAKERTKSEFSVLFKQAGLELKRIIPTPSSFYILEGKIIQ